jgi:hypothetical protein
MRNLKRAFAVVVLALAVVMPGATGAGAEEPGREAELAREFLDLSGAGALGHQVMTQMIEFFRTANPEIPEEFWDRFLEDADSQELEDRVIPIYVEHFTAEELEASIAFYRTPAGQSILQKMPVVMQESMEVGQQWGMELGQKLAEELEARREAKKE